MAVAAMTKCDCGCGASSEAPGEQGWWLTYGGVTLFEVRRWDADLDALQECQHAAGSECVHKLLNAWMEQQREGK